MRRRNGTKKANDRSGLLLLLAGCVLLTVVLSRWLLGAHAAADIPAEAAPTAAAEAGAAVGAVKEQVENWVPYVLAAEISAEFGSETLRAQAVVARSLLYWLLNHEIDTGNEAVLSEAWMQEQGVSWKTKEELGEDLALYQEAAEATAGCVLTCGGSVILPLYHMCSAGRTRDGGEAFAYLKSQESAADLLVAGSLRVLWLAPEDFAYAFSQAAGETISAAELGFGGAEGGSVQAETDSAGYVERVVCSPGEGKERKETDGEAFAKELGLPSAHYEWTECEGKIRLVCRGIGHGYGLSQWGAQALYEQGYGWEEILSWYFSGTEIAKPE